MWKMKVNHVGHKEQPTVIPRHYNGLTN